MTSYSIKAPIGARRARKTRGRGSASGCGGTAGRGTKGQKSRSGGGVRPGFEGGQMPLFRRVARRGFSNRIFQKREVTISVRDLCRTFSQGEIVTKSKLKRRGLVARTSSQVKVLGNGEANRRLVVRVDRVSASARAKLEGAGGDVAISTPAKGR